MPKPAAAFVLLFEAKEPWKNLREAKCGGVYVGLFSKLAKHRAGGNGHKVAPWMLRLVIRENFFTEKLLKPWEGMPRAVAECPCWRDVKGLRMWCSGNGLVLAWAA